MKFFLLGKKERYVLCGACRQVRSSVAAIGSAAGERIETLRWWAPSILPAARSARRWLWRWRRKKKGGGAASTVHCFPWENPSDCVNHYPWHHKIDNRSVGKAQGARCAPQKFRETDSIDWKKAQLSGCTSQQRIERNCKPIMTDDQSSQAQPYNQAVAQHATNNGNQNMVHKNDPVLTELIKLARKPPKEVNKHD